MKSAQWMFFGLLFLLLMFLHLTNRRVDALEKLAVAQQSQLNSTLSLIGTNIDTVGHVINALNTQTASVGMLTEIVSKIQTTGEAR